MIIDISDPNAVESAIANWRAERANKGLPLTPASLRSALGISKNKLTSYAAVDIEGIANKKETTNREKCDFYIAQALNDCGSSMEDYYSAKDIKHDLFGKAHLSAVGEWDSSEQNTMTIRFVGIDEVED